MDWAIDSIKKQREPNNMSPDGKKLLMLPSSDYFLPIPHIVVSYSVAQTESYWKVTRGQVHEPTKLELEAARQAGTISKIDLPNYVYGYVIDFFFLTIGTRNWIPSATAFPLLAKLLYFFIISIFFFLYV